MAMWKILEKQFFSVARVTTCSSPLPKVTMIDAVVVVQLLAASFSTFRPVGGQTILPLLDSSWDVIWVKHYTVVILAALMRLLNSLPFKQIVS